MKKLAIAVFLMGLIFAGCSNKEKEQAEMERIRQDSIRVADSVAVVQKNMEIEKKRVERRKILESGDTFAGTARDSANLANIALEGKVIVLSEEGETMPFKLEGSNVYAITMPDGKLYQVDKSGDKIMLTVPGKGKMERKMINGNIYLVDNNDQMYEVKVKNKKLIAVLSNGTEVNLARK